MKSAIVYYSYSGNTRKVANILAEYLKQKSEVELIELKPADESRNFFVQCYRAIFRKRAAIGIANLDLAKFHLVCFATPVWAFGPAPAMNSYLDKCSGVEGKRIILFTTFGSGTGNERCLKYMQDILLGKGAGNIGEFSIQQFKVKDRAFVLAEIEKVARL